MANLRVDKITSTETFETTGSVQFDGDADYLQASNSDDFQLGTGDFTVEAWVLANDNSGSRQIISMSDGSENWQLFTHSGGTLRWNSRGTGDSGTTGYNADVDLETGTWHHVAATRSGNTLRLFKNGIVVGTFGYNSDLTLSAGGPSIGIWDADKTSEDWQGHISNVRIIKGKALYTANFKPSMRELEVTPETVLLACQSKTDATLEKTGKTLTVGGNAIASELTPGILTPVPKAGAGSAITGSIVFDGGDDYLSIPDSDDFYFEDHKFTIEFWAYTGTDTTSNRTLFSQWAAGSDRNLQFDLRGDASKVWRFYYRTSSTTEFVSGNDPVAPNSWYHVAAVADGTNLKLYVNGVLQETNAIAGDAQNSTQPLIIGAYSASPEYWWDGYISNLRIVKGTALYTADFIPPTRELKKVPGTSLLCCQDENSVTTEATGKTISAYGSITASNFTPQVGDDRKVTFEGVTKINSDAYFYLPTGNTVTRESRSGYGNRGLFSLGAAPTAVNTIEFVNIASTGDSKDFGDLTYTIDGSNASCSSSTRGIFGGGRESPSPGGNINHINYVTIASTGDAKDFGDLTQIRRGITGHGSSIRGIFAGGRADPGPNPTDTIDFITISSTGNALDFGNLITARRYSGSTSSSTRGLVAGGADPGKLNSIEYVTIPSKGNALDFGDLSNNIDQTEGNSNGVRGIFGGGGSHPNYYNTIDYVTIASTGNAKDFGDLLYTRVDSASASNCIRGVFAGGHNPTKFNDIQYVNISSTGNALDFGSLSTTSAEGSGCSDSHGGLG